MRIPFIAGNWKMYKNIKEAVEFAAIFAPLYHDTDVRTAIFAPFPQLGPLADAFRGTGIGVGAQNVHFEEEGAFTGEVSVPMLKELGVDYCLVGHSERRQYFGETDATVNKRVRAALDAGLKVILCVGELLEQRELGITEEICAMQTKVALGGVTEQELKNIIIAYEPVWAIGTGKTATSDQADEVNGYIRSVVAKLYGDAAAEAMTIQYGGSMNAKNAEELLSKEHVDGGLIGGASLKAPDFAAIVSAASK